MLFSLLALSLSGCDRSPSSSSPVLETEALRLTSATSSDIIAYLAAPQQANYLTITDFDHNGFSDVAFVSHGGNQACIHFQMGKRQWAQGPAITEVGFHPGELLSLPTDGDQARYLLFAEGSGSLRVMSLTRQGGLRAEFDLPVYSPRSGTLFRWPDWGLGVAVGPFSKSSIFLFKHFTSSGKGDVQGVEIPFTPAIARIEGVIAADLDADQVDEILFAQPLDNTVKMIRYPGAEGQPKVENLWSFEPGGRARFVVPGDVDQDGDLDLLIPDETEPVGSVTSVNILINQGRQGWRHTPIIFPSRTRAEKGQTGIRGFAFGIDKDGVGYALAAGYERLVLFAIPAGWDYTTPASHSLPLTSKKLLITDAELKDVDGDGLLDAVMATGAGGLVIYGPLWQHFELIEKDDLLAKSAPQDTTPVESSEAEHPSDNPNPGSSVKPD